jgi:hypothetical protein
MVEFRENPRELALLCASTLLPQGSVRLGWPVGIKIEVEVIEVILDQCKCKLENLMQSFAPLDIACRRLLFNVIACDTDFMVLRLFLLK